MLPEFNVDLSGDDFSYPSKTYKMLKTDDDYRIDGYVDEIESIKQSIYRILRTERYDKSIYTWNYGIQLKDLYGKDTNYAIAVLENRIKDALSADDRILETSNYVFEKSNKNTILVSFTANTIYGETEVNEEVKF